MLLSPYVYKRKKLISLHKFLEFKDTVKYDILACTQKLTVSLI